MVLGVAEGRPQAPRTPLCLVWPRVLNQHQARYGSFVWPNPPQAPPEFLRASVGYGGFRGPRGHPWGRAGPCAQEVPGTPFSSLLGAPRGPPGENPMKAKRPYKSYLGGPAGPFSGPSSNPGHQPRAPPWGTPTQAPPPPGQPPRAPTPGHLPRAPSREPPGNPPGR